MANGDDPSGTKQNAILRNRVAAETAESMSRQDVISTTAARVRADYEAGRAAQLDPAFQPGAIAAATARQPLQTATQPGHGALDVVPPGTPLMSPAGNAAVQPGVIAANARAPQPGFADLADSAVAARQQIESRRAQLIPQLAYANSRQRRVITAELQGLSQQEHFAEWNANQRRIQAHVDALEADKQVNRERDTRIDQQGADAIMQMHTLDNSRRSGQITQEQYDDRMLALGNTHFEALHRHPAASKLWAEHLDQEHKRGEYQTRVNIREAAKLSKYGVPIQVDENTGEIDLDAMRKAAVGTPKGQAEALGNLNAEMQKRYGVSLASVFENAKGGRGEGTKFKPTDPGDKKNPQTHVQMQVISPSGKVELDTFPKAKFDEIKNLFQPAYNQILAAAQPVPQGGAQSAPVGLQVNSEAEYNQLPSGSMYVDPNGVRRRKP